MDKRQKKTAYNILNEFSQEKLEDIFWKYGEERWAKRIARAVMEKAPEVATNVVQAAPNYALWFLLGVAVIVTVYVIYKYIKHKRNN